MSDMTPEEVARRGHRAEQAMEEFFAPALCYVIDTYTKRLKEVCANSPWEAGKIAALANAIRVAEEVGKDITGYIYDGEHAGKQLIRAERIEKMSPTKRKFLNFAPH